VRLRNLDKHRDLKVGQCPGTLGFFDLNCREQANALIQPSFYVTGTRNEFVTANSRPSARKFRWAEHLEVVIAIVNNGERPLLSREYPFARTLPRGTRRFPLASSGVNLHHLRPFPPLEQMDTLEVRRFVHLEGQQIRE
jgi:hypothetical protein